jgi:hypothetical protein
MCSKRRKIVCSVYGNCPKPLEATASRDLYQLTNKVNRQALLYLKLSGEEAKIRLLPVT